MVLSGALAACSDVPAQRGDAVQRPPPAAATQALAPERKPPAHCRNIQRNSRLGQLSDRIEREAINRSTALQELRATEQTRRSLEFDRFPTITPTATTSTLGDGTPSVGVNITQTVWDAGETASRFASADLDIDDAKVRAWVERNDAVFDGLSSFMEITRLSERLRSYRALEAQLQGLADILQDRADGGVDDRAEGLRMSVAFQEVRREIVDDETTLRAARSQLLRVLPTGSEITPLQNISQAPAMCSRNWSPGTDGPAVTLAGIQVRQAEENARRVASRRFPKVLLVAGAAYSGSGETDTSVGLQLDASELLGLGRRHSVEAANFEIQAAIRNRATTEKTLAADVGQLAQEYSGLVRAEGQLQGLLQANAEALGVYRDQVDVGSVPITAGIDLYREATNARLSLIDLHSDMVLNCLRISRIRGTLVDFETDEN